MSGRHLPWDWYPEPLPGNVEVGERSWVYSSFAFLHHRSVRPDAVRIGADSGVYHGSFFETGTAGRVEIGDFCAVAGPVMATNGRIAIGDYAFISYGVAIADSFAAVPPHPGEEAGGSEIVIGDNVWIGARATVLGGARIGDDAVIGALSVVDFEVPAGALVAGNPARVVGEAR